VPIRRLLISLIFVIAAGCSHAPVEPARQLTPEEFAHEAEHAISEFLKKRPEVSAVNSVRMLDTREEREGLVRIAYQVAYETRSEKYGKVTHSIESEAEVENDGKGRWTIKNARPRTQGITYHDPAVVTVPRQAPSQ
jgi:hypothetical protein